ncbi:MAG: diguanylate cyclase [Oceanidesulfovibrio sp.]
MPFVRGMLITKDDSLETVFQSLAPVKRMSWECFSTTAGAMERLFTDPPDILVVDDTLDNGAGAKFVNIIKSENVYRRLPVVLCLERDALQNGLIWNQIEADDFLLKPLDPEETASRIAITLNRSVRSMDANPLSSLPGNTSIIQRIQELVDAGREFALLYCDLDHFKSYNDKYGFIRGDEVLMMTSRVIVNTIRSMGLDYSFVGHVGGDDFLCIVPMAMAEESCRRIIGNFDPILPNFYDPEDRDKGCIYAENRLGEKQCFPLMTMSIAVVMNHGGKIQHYGAAAYAASQLKKMAKEKEGSVYVIDQRNA